MSETVDQSCDVTQNDDKTMNSVSNDQLQPLAQNLPRSSTPPMSAQIAIDSNSIDIPLDTVDSQSRKVTPKKQIKVTKNGKLVSSPPKPTTIPSDPPRKRRGRPPKVKVSPTVTIIKYGSDATSRLAIGQRIEDIINGKIPPKGRRAKKVPLKPVEPPKVTHPFFTGKADQRKDDPAAKPPTQHSLVPPRKSACTPGKLRAEARRDQPTEPMPTFGVSSLNSRIAKQSGLNEALWPTRETAHVRNFEVAGPDQCPKYKRISHPAIKPRKMKNTVTSFPREEDLVTRLSRELSSSIHKEVGSLESDFEPPEDVRLPERLLVTGSEIQRRVRSQVHTRLPMAGVQHGDLTDTHPAITTLFNEIEHTLTPFDEGRCETQTWAQKYSPKCASHVLGSDKEAFVLKDWLQSLTVMAVGGAQGLSKPTIPSDIKKPPKKKRKKVEDAFIVEDDEEEEEGMVEILDTNGAGAHQTASYRRPFWTRSKNVILLSGPHGCGKSAAVYAVAKELDFEVFEMNSGARRSGKDIQDKVGDMTANHLVNHQRGGGPTSEEPASANDTDNERMSTAFQRDLDSGRQGTMQSFFKVGPTSEAKPKTKSMAREPGKVPTSAAQTILPITGPQRKSQKQSLILFEEADILFEEDQNFWSQVIKLASQSKRPIVITCNDERQIPIQELPLAAMLRLVPPPVNLATDYLLVLAGREGHVLERQTISNLFQSKHRDLRASITELDLWCQMSVGDRKGGLEWMYQRWPPGKDVDKHGQLLRIASKDTYQSGMGWLSYNILKSNDNIGFEKQDELAKNIWQEWGIDPVEGCDEKTNHERTPALSGNDRLRELERLETWTDSLSAMDVYCRIDLPSYTHVYDQPTDPTQPLITKKERLSYTLAAPVLQVDHQSDFLALDTSIYTSSCVQIQHAFPNLLQHLSNSPPPPESTYSQSILSHLNKRQTHRPLLRSSFACLDILAASPDLPPTSALFLSSFDRTLPIITLDLAPYIRSIIAHEQALEERRIRVSNLLSEGGNGNRKRARTTRASRVAMEGGVREFKRRERWFDEDLSFEEVMRTGGTWAGLGWRAEGAGTGDGEGSVTGTMESGGDEMDGGDVVMRDGRE